MQGAFKFSGTCTGLFERMDAIAQLRGFFILTIRGGVEHLLLEFREPLFCFAVKEATCGFDTLEVLGFAQFIGMLKNFGAGVVVEAPLVSVELQRAGVAE